MPQAALEGRLVCGELGLDGAIRPVRGGLAIADLAGRMALRELLLPAANAGEAAALGGVPVIPLRALGDAVEHVLGQSPLAGVAPDPRVETRGTEAPDLADVRGQETAKRALEIAAAGGHNLLFIGPPGSGKTMLAQRLPGLLPPLTLPEAIAVTKIHSLVAEQPPAGLVWRRPFRNPHPGTSSVGLVGGGPLPRPGEASLAHAGVLFLDELPEFRRDTLEALRQPLEEGQVTVVRARAVLHFPARFALLAAMNPCPCGHLGDPRAECRCVPLSVERYRSRISGPLLDRIDLHVEVPALSLGDLRGRGGETSREVALRVAAARQIQLLRFSNSPVPCNAAMDAEAVRRQCRLDAAGQALLDRAFEQARALGACLRPHPESRPHHRRPRGSRGACGRRTSPRRSSTAAWTDGPCGSERPAPVVACGDDLLDRSRVRSEGSPAKRERATGPPPSRQCTYPSGRQ